MNPIKTFAILILASLTVSCSKDDYKLGSDIDPFVRFNFLVNSNNTPLTYPAVNAGLLPQSSYVNSAIKTLKVPVALTARSLKDAVAVSYSAVSSTGGTDDFTINPANELMFQGVKLTDTIFISFDKRWQEEQTITLKLENASDPSVHIGNLNTEAIHDVFTIKLAQIATTYTFPVNNIELKGEIGETIDFKVNFPEGFFPSEIENNAIFDFLNGFDYSLTHDDFDDNRNSITYRLTLLEDLQNDDIRYESFISLNETETYKTVGNTILQITKPIKKPRDVQANPAANFYNLSDAFYRTYGAHWFDRNGTCTWLAFNAFTFPVIVSENNPDAIQYSGQNTPDSSDDVYHDAFKIGFNVVTGSATTNSFGLKNWFTNESVNAANSPGFNITSALEFFPENGNSKTSGNVLVIPKFITIAGSNGNSHSIFISGEGTYKQLPNGFFEISFELKLKNDKLFGGTVSSHYRIYNKNGFPALAPLTESCLKPVEL